MACVECRRIKSEKLNAEKRRITRHNKDVANLNAKIAELREALERARNLTGPDEVIDAVLEKARA